MSLSDRALARLAADVGRNLLRSQYTIATAESCTGGFIAKCLTDIAGSSAWFESGFVTYGNQAKRKLLHVAAGTLRKHGAVSSETALEMSRGALRAASADIAVAVTGIAGPGGAVPGKPVGTVCFGWARKNGRKILIFTAVEHFSGARDTVRRKSVRRALHGVLELIQ